MSPGEVWRRSSSKRERLRREVFALYGDRCHLCGRPGADTLDHLLPKVRFPALMFVVENLRPAHRACNSSRGDAGLSKSRRVGAERVEVASGW